MSVRYVNNSNSLQDGRYTFSSIQAAINSSASGDSVVLEDNMTYRENVVLRNGVDLICRNGVAVIESDNANPAVIDNGVAVSCTLMNLVFSNTSTGRGATFSGASRIECVNVLVQSAATWGIFTSQAEVVGLRATGTIGFYNAGIARNCVGSSTSGAGFNSEGGSSYSCVGISTGANGFRNSVAGRAFNCLGISSAAGAVGFHNEGATSVECCGISSLQTGMLSGSTAANRAMIMNCVGIALGPGGGGVAVGISMSRGAGFLQSEAHGCRAYSLNATGGEAFNCYENTVAINCSGYSFALEGMAFIGATGTNCSGTSGSVCGISSFNAAVFGGSDIGATLVNCSGYSDTREALLIQSNLAQAGNMIYGGSFVSNFNAANGHGCSISGTAPITGVTEIYNATFRCLHAAANSISAVNAATPVAYAGVTANRVVNANVAQTVVAIADAQGNIFG